MTQDAQPSQPEPAALLVSFAYLQGFMRSARAADGGWRIPVRDWALDSGAFTAMASGKPVSLADYVSTIRDLRATDPLLSEVFALDVIGDYRASRQNVERMWAAGIQAIPCFHQGSPWDELLGLARDYPKIALGGVARLKAKAKIEFARACFGRIWRALGPKPIHGFGYGAPEQVRAVPWHSVDASSWELRPAGFGSWVSFGTRLNTSFAADKRGAMTLRPEVEFYLSLERDIRNLWSREIAKMATDRPVCIRLATGNSDRLLRAYGVEP